MTGTGRRSCTFSGSNEPSEPSERGCCGTMRLLAGCMIRRNTFVGLWVVESRHSSSRMTLASCRLSVCLDLISMDVSAKANGTPSESNMPFVYSGMTVLTMVSCRFIAGLCRGVSSGSSGMCKMPDISVRRLVLRWSDPFSCLDMQMLL